MKPTTNKLKLFTEKELPSKIDILIKDSDANIRKLGKELKKGLDTGFENLNAILGEISKLLLVGALTPFILLIVLSALSIAIITVPSAIIINALSNQKRFIKSRAKSDEVTKSYFTAIDNLLVGDLSGYVSLESMFESALEILNPVMEAPNEEDDTEEEDEEDPENQEPETEEINDNDGDETATDYTEDVDDPDEETGDDLTANDFTGDVVDPDNEEEPEAEEPDEATDYTEDIGGENNETDGENTEEDPTDTENTEQPVDTGQTTDGTDTPDEPTGGEDEGTGAEGETVPEEGEVDGVENEETETGEEDVVPEEEPTDFTDQVDDGTADETGEEGGDNVTGEETTDDTVTTDETDQDNNKLENSIVKNYNLMVDFQKMYSIIEDILKRLNSVTYPTTIQNSVLDRCIVNITKIKEELLAYIEINYSGDYKENLYYYNTYIQALKLNLEILNRVKMLNKGSKQ